MDLQLKKLRTEKGYSQDQMADMLSIKTSRYGTWERGERAMSLSQAVDCAELLGCTLDELAGREPTRKNRYIDPAQAKMNTIYEGMNAQGRRRLAEDAEIMAMSGLYQKTEDNPVSRTA